MNTKFALRRGARCALARRLCPAGSRSRQRLLSRCRHHRRLISANSLDDNSFKIIAGFRPLDWLAVEANYLDLGGGSNGSDSVDASAFTVSGLLIAEFAVIDLYARLGVANWQADAGGFSDDGWEPALGAGIGAHFGSLGLRAEYEVIDASYFEAKTISLSFTYTFL